MGCGALELPRAATALKHGLILRAETLYRHGFQGQLRRLCEAVVKQIPRATLLRTRRAAVGLSATLGVSKTYSGGRCGL